MTETTASRLDRGRRRAGSLPAASWLALAGAGLAVVLEVRSAQAALDVGMAGGGVLAFVAPYVVVAIALRGRSVMSRGFGVGTAALMTWLTSFGVTEFVSSVQHANPLRPTAVTFLALTAVGLAVTLLGLRDLAMAVHATGYWTLTPLASRLAFGAVCFWTLTFVADTYLTANPPLARMLMAPALVLLHLGAALMLRARGRDPRAAGVLLVGAAAVTTVASWVALSPYLTLTAVPAAVPGLGYSTLLPWPVLLAVSLAIDVAIVGTAARRTR